MQAAEDEAPSRLGPARSAPPPGTRWPRRRGLRPRSSPRRRARPDRVSGARARAPRVDHAAHEAAGEDRRQAWPAAGRCRQRRRGRAGRPASRTSANEAPVPTRPQGSAPASTPSITVFIEGGLRRGQVRRPEGVGTAEQQHRSRDRPACERRADELSRLLSGRSRAHEVAGLQVLRDVAAPWRRRRTPPVPTVRIAARAEGSSVQPSATNTTATPEQRHQRHAGGGVRTSDRR